MGGRRDRSGREEEEEGRRVDMGRRRWEREELEEEAEEALRASTKH